MCNDADNAPATSNSRGEQYEQGSRCYDSSVAQDYYVASSTVVQACHKTRCNGGTLELQLTKYDGSTVWLACTSNGATISAPSGFTGTVTCPDIATLMCDPHSCPGLPCDGTDLCHSGVCTCGAAWPVGCGS